MSRDIRLIYARFSFVEGIARLFDFAGNLDDDETFLSQEQIEALLLVRDWEAVSKDMQKACRKLSYTDPITDSKFLESCQKLTIKLSKNNMRKNQSSRDDKFTTTV